MREREIDFTKLQKGDPETTTSVIDKNQPILLARAFFMMSLLPPPHDTHDLVQDTWFKFFRAVYTNRVKSTTEPHWDTRFLLTIEKNQFLDQRLRSVRHPADLIKEVPDNAVPINSTLQLTPEEKVISNESYNHLLDIIDELPDGLKEIIILKSVERLSYDEVAKRLSVNRNTAGTRIYRARRSLQAALA